MKNKKEIQDRTEIIYSIKELYKSAQDLLSNKQFEFAAIQCRKIIEAFRILQRNDNRTLGTPAERAISYFFSQMGNKAAHFGQFTEPEKKLFSEAFSDIKDLIDLYINEPIEVPSLSKYKNCIKYFSISNFQCIKQAEAQLPIDTQFIVFTGENGDGKTSILQAIAIGIKGNYDKQSGLIWCNDENFNVYIGFQNSEKNTIYNQISLENFLETPTFNNFAAYSASRLILQSAESMEDNKNKRSATYNLFRNEGTLLNIEYWLRELVFAGKNEKVKQISDLLVKLLPKVEKIELKGSKFEYLEKGIFVPIEHLSSGHKSIVLMIGDMLIRLSEAQADIDNPKDFAGIVLIDELEAHLHPKWQKEFPKILAETFPKVQFIVTTHSAITLLGMPKNTVFFKVKRTEEEGTQIERLEIDVENLTPNLILNSPLFGLADIFSVQNKGIENIHTGDFFDEKDARKQAKDKIRTLYKQQKDKENNEKSI